MESVYILVQTSPGAQPTADWLTGTLRSACCDPRRSVTVRDLRGSHATPFDVAQACIFANGFPPSRTDLTQ
jgi:hypothetical protein